MSIKGKLLTLSLSATMLFSLPLATSVSAEEQGQEVTFAEENDVNENDSQIETNSASQDDTKLVQEQNSQDTSQALEENQDTHTPSTQAVAVGETVDSLEKLKDQSTVTKYDDGETKTRTWDVPINIEITGKTAPFDSSTWGYVMGGLESLEANKEALTYIFNKPVNIVIDNCQGKEIQLIRRNMTSTYGSWIFNAPVTFTVKNSKANYIQGMQVYSSGGEFYSERNKKWGVQMNDKYTINVENCTVYDNSVDGIEFIGGGKKMFARSTTADVSKDEWKSGVQKGLDIHVKNTELYTLNVGHYIHTYGIDNTDPDFYMNGDINVTLDNSKVTGSFNSSIAPKTWKDKLTINGKLNVNCINGSNIRVFYGNGATYTSSIAIGDVTGGVTLSSDEAVSMTGLKGVDVLNISDRVDVLSTTELPTNGMKLNLVDPKKWNDEDVIFTTVAMNVPSLGGWIYPKVDTSKVTSNWNNPNLILKYKETQESRNVNFGGNIGSKAATVYTQIWYLTKNVTVSYDTDGGTPVNPETVLQKEKVTKPTTTKEHATFGGWFTDKTYQTEWNFDDPVMDDMTLYAKWIVDKQTVKVEPNDGTTINDVKVPYGNPMSEPTLSPRKGYTLEGWYTTKDFQEDTKWDFKTPVEKDMTIYAKWKRNVQTVKVEPNDGTTISDVKVPYGNSISEPKLSSRKGYTLKGWYTTKDFQEDTKWDFASGVEEDMTLYAKWVQKETPVNPDQPVNPSNPEQPSNTGNPENKNSEKVEAVQKNKTVTTETAKKKVKTSDDTNLVLYGELTALAFIGIMIIYLSKKRDGLKMK